MDISTDVNQKYVSQISNTEPVVAQFCYGWLDLLMVLQTAVFLAAAKLQEVDLN